ncbi:IclR family transcriptional regulator [Bosea sp. 2YAB26]|uniref:IclR family transcriptional regulator n=1 Tax=Bosea sp. 2YAB26 TaxID=3237478 RepID=UPI003F8E1D39
MNALGRFVSLLRLFRETKGSWTVQDMSEALSVPASTVYRTVRELVGEGFLEPAYEAHYRLGPAFVEFDRLVRLTDPLVRAGQSRLHDLIAQAGVPCVALLARLYGDTVLCVADEAVGNLPARPSYERGRPMPLTRGATSKTILSLVPPRRLARLVAGSFGGQPGADQADLPMKIAELRDLLAGIRKRGYCITRGEIDEGLVGIAVPVAVPELGIAASISLVLDAASLDEKLEHRLVLLLVSSASLLGDRLSGSRLDGADVSQ